MKKYRCPYCGEECLSYSGRNMYFYSSKQRLYRMKKGNSCPECTQHYVALARRSLGAAIFGLVYSVSLLAGIYLMFVVNPVYLILLLAYLLVGLFVINPISNSLSCATVQYDQDEQKPVILKDNAIVELTNQTRKIKHLDIYGVQFLQKSEVVRFKEAFTNQLVPTVFYINNKQTKNSINVTFMKAEFIPPALFCEGAEFVVIDNGEQIANGVIVKIFEDAKPKG